MCLIAFAWQAHPDYPLILAANRDEYFARPAEPMHWWPDAPLLAGRDRTGGGTWLALTRSGRLAALTNYRDPTQHRPGAPSRGALVVAAALADSAPLAVLERLAERKDEYPPFNLIVIDRNEAAILESRTGRVALIPPSLHVLSNALLNTPWPKAERARELLGAAIFPRPSRERLLALLTDRAHAPDDLLPETGIAPDWERALSAIFVQAPGYGTRCSTLVLRRADGTTEVEEITWNEEGKMASSVRFSVTPSD
jgi:uncharacterized protein with NRDE domain